MSQTSEGGKGHGESIGKGNRRDHEASSKERRRDQAVSSSTDNRIIRTSNKGKGSGKNQNAGNIRIKRHSSSYQLKLKAGLVLSAALLLLALIACFRTPYSPTEMNSSLIMQSPSLAHWMGTDNMGRDVFSRVLAGSGITFLVAAITVLASLTAGVILGFISGYFGGMADGIIMRICDVMLSFPSMLLALIVISIMGKGTENIVAALSILFVPSFVRIARSEMIRLKNLDFVLGERALGVKTWKIIFAHILPNALPSLLTSVVIGFNNAVLAEAGMSYLGLGVQPPTSSLGRMISEAQDFLFTAPWYAMGAGLWIILMILGFSLMAEGLKDMEE
ncbi:MAG: ABC transporter permease [Lachnospiraceae bacterium]|nr:ABC transporter permease [Lachnospiraceae bacterium]